MSLEVVMNICLIDSSGASYTIDLTSQQPTLDNINNDWLLLENHYYKAIIRGYDFSSNVELYIGDYNVPLRLNADTDCYETEKTTLFSGCFDLANMCVYEKGADGSEHGYYSNFIRVATTKQTVQQVTRMLNEIERNLPNFLEVCFSKNRKEAGLRNNDYRSIWNTLKILNDIVEIYNDNYSYFANHKKASVEPVSAIVDVTEMQRIDFDGLRWIVNNPDNLMQTNEKTGITFRGQEYVPRKVKTYLSQYSYDLYENQVVLGFLNSVYEYVSDEINQFNREISELNDAPEKIVAKIPNTYELTTRCVYVYYQGVIHRLQDVQDKILQLYNRYYKIMECSPAEVYGIPKLTNTFKQVYQYRMVFEAINDWYSSGDYAFEHLNYLFKLKTLSRIFEYYCLIKFQLCITGCGFKLESTDRIVYDPEDDLEEINNKYLFTGANKTLELLYEPSVWTDKLNGEGNLYSTGYNFSKAIWNKAWTPDFVIKITTEQNEYYYIIDAKYSKEENVKRLYLRELVLKYSAQIASYNKYHSDVIGVGAIFPNDEDRYKSYKRNNIRSSKESLPQYFSVSVGYDEIGTVNLKKHLKKLIDLVDILEEEQTAVSHINARIEESAQSEHIQEEENSEKSLTVDDSELETNKAADILQVEHIADSTDKESDFDSNSDSPERKSQPISQSKKKGDVIKAKILHKNCFYYGKGYCMAQKKFCNGDDCKIFTPKQENKLLKEENTCRNFITYTRRERVSRVECKISGLPGCVGPDKCAFLLKKKKS